MSYLDQLNATPKFEVIRPKKPKHSYFLKLTSSFLPIFVLAFGLGAALILMRDRQKVTTKASLETTNLFMVNNNLEISIFAATSSGKLVAIEMPITFSNDLLSYVPDYVPSQNLPHLLPGSVVSESEGKMTFIVASPPNSPMLPAGLVGTVKFRSKGIGGLAHIAFGAVKIAGLNSLGEPLSQNLAGTLTGVDIELAGPTATPTPTPTTPVATATLGASRTPTERPYNNCGGTCGSNINCKGELYCYFPDIKNRPYDGVCRNPFCDRATDCDCKPTATPTPRPTSLPLSPTSTRSPSPTIKPTATSIPTPFVVKVPSSTPSLSHISLPSPTSILSPTSPTPTPTPVSKKESGWWEKFLEWLRGLLGK